MRKILVPTDFSDCASNAGKVALQIAQKAKAQIDFLHILVTPIDWVSLDYETTDIIIRFYLNTLNFNADTLNNILQSSLKEVIFKGAFSLDYINTEGHPPLYFTVEGLLEAGNTKRTNDGKGELHHVDGSDNFACLLGMKMYLNLQDYNIEIPNLEDEIEVIITQALLKKDKN